MWPRWYSTLASVLFFGQGGRTHGLSRRLNLIAKRFLFSSCVGGVVHLLETGIRTITEVYPFYGMEQSSTPSARIRGTGRRGRGFLCTACVRGIDVRLLRCVTGGECPLPSGTIKYCQVLWEFFCSDMYKNLWLGEASSGFSSKRSSYCEWRSDLLIFSLIVLCLETFFK